MKAAVVAVEIACCTRSTGKKPHKKKTRNKPDKHR